MQLNPARNNSSGAAGHLQALVLAIVLGLLIAFVLPADAQEGSDLEDELEQAEDNLAEARAQQAVIQSQVGDAQAVLQQLDTQILGLENDLRVLEADLAVATATHEAARARTDTVAADLSLLTDELEQSRDDLAYDKDRFDSRIAASYMYGGPMAMADVLFQSQDFGEFVRTSYYISSILEDDKTLIDRVSEQTRQLAFERSEVERLRDQLATEQAAAERARVEVERATELQRSLTTQVNDERRTRSATLVALENNLDTYSQLVASYEAESARIAQELAASRWRAGAPGKGELLWPTNGSAGSGFGYRTHPIYGSRRFHAGVDISGSIGQEIVSAAEGLVVHAGWRGGYGLAVIIDHGGGLATLYAHQSRILVEDGEVVAAGAPIGEVGSTGQSTGPHLHYEVRVEGVPNDPMEWY